MKIISNNRRWLSSALRLSAVHFITDLYPGYLAPLLPLLMNQYDFSITFAGMLAAVSSLSCSLTQPFFGWLNDRMNRRLFIIFGPIISAVFYSLIGYMPDKWFLVLCVFLGGLGVAQFHPQAAAVTSELGGVNKGKAISVFAAGGTIGYPLGALIITSVIVPLWGLKSAPVFILPALILIFFMIRLNRADKREARPEAFYERPAFGQVWDISLYVLIGIIRSLVIMGFNFLVPIWYAQQALSLQHGGFAIFIFHFMGGLGGLAGGFISDRYSSKKIILFSFLTGGLLLVTFTYSSGFLSLILLGLSGAVLFSSIPAVITEAQDTTPIYKGAVSSLVMGFSWGVGGILVMVVSHFADLYGVFPAMRVISYIPFLAFGLAVLLKPQSPLDICIEE